MIMEDYITTHCVASIGKVGRLIPIRVIKNMSLKIIMLVLTCISGSA
jgi:hypothetical protein